MNKHPILFNSEMVRAILDGRKTQTRRVIKLQPEKVYFTPDRPDWGWHTHQKGGTQLFCPYGKVGDVLYVREGWRIGAWDEEGGVCIDYKADGYSGPEYIQIFSEEDDLDGERYNKLWIQCGEDADKAGEELDDEQYHWDKGASPCRWRPNIHMPKTIARIFLEITNIRVEKIRDISEEDAKAEGCVQKHLDDLGQSWKSYKRGFQSLWDSINRKRGYGWYKNPWVWVVEFKLKGENNER